MVIMLVQRDWLHLCHLTRHQPASHMAAALVQLRTTCVSRAQSWTLIAGPYLFPSQVSSLLLLRCFVGTILLSMPVPIAQFLLPSLLGLLLCLLLLCLWLKFSHCDLCIFPVL